MAEAFKHVVDGDGTVCRAAVCGMSAPEEACIARAFCIQCKLPVAGLWGRLIQTLVRYVNDHWQGHHGLAWSFWVNLVLIRVLVFLAQEWISPATGHVSIDCNALIPALVLVFHGILFFWQVIGVLRAAGFHVRSSGSMAPVWGVQMAVIVAFFWTISYTIEAWQITLPASDKVPSQAELNAERAAKYNIEPSVDGRSLTLTGSLELGITARLKDQLEVHPNVEQIVLASTGGNIYEARGLANAIRQNGLNTKVIGECSSACTTVFIGGAERRLASGGKLGFHQYRIDADYAVLNADPVREQTRDRAIFLASGVAIWFVDKMFDSDASEMWFPEISELIDARVVTAAPIQSTD